MRLRGRIAPRQPLLHGRAPSRCTSPAGAVRRRGGASELRVPRRGPRVRDRLPTTAACPPPHRGDQPRRRALVRAPRPRSRPARPRAGARLAARRHRRWARARVVGAGPAGRATRPSTCCAAPRRARAREHLRRRLALRHGLRLRRGRHALAPDDLEHSALAVQGPPGTGKTYVGAHVITALVRDHGWKIGVVAQSHTVVENVLRAGRAGGRPDPASASRARSPSGATYACRPVAATTGDRRSTRRGARLAATSSAAPRGTSTNLKRIDRRQLDLLVIDEAGQFSLAATIAASVAAAQRCCCSATRSSCRR